MLLNPDLSPDLAPPCTRRGLRASASAGALALLAACSTPPLSPCEAPATQQSAAPATLSIPTPDSATPQAPQAPSSAPASPGPSASTIALPDPESVMRLLAYADRVRALPPFELAQEAARLGNPPTPAEQLQLALVLSQMRQTPELIRAQELLARVLANAQAQPLHPLARLLTARYSEQRRLEEQLDRQTQQTRDVQRRLDQTHDRLEALKAIERSLTNRPPAAAAPASRTRPAP